MPATAVHPTRPAPAAEPDGAHHPRRSGALVSRRLSSTTAVVLATTTALTLALAPAGAEAKSRKLECKSGLQWSRMTTGFAPAFTRRLENNTSKTAKQTVTVEKSRTIRKKISAGVETSVEGGFLAIQASVKAQFGAEVEESVTTKLGFTSEVPVGPNREVTWRYGAYTKVLRGYVFGRDENVNGPPAFEGCALTRFATVRATIPTRDEGAKLTERRLRRRS
jgi:hypothetical protein